MSNNIQIKAYRIKGGAIVRVIRGSKTRRYKVSLKRFSALKYILLVWKGAFGYHGGGSLDITLPSQQGYSDALQWIKANGSQTAQRAVSGSQRARP